MPYADKEREKAYRAAKYAANREEINAQRRAYRAASPEKIREQQRAAYRRRSAAQQLATSRYYRLHRDEILRKKKVYQQANQDKIKARLKARRLADPVGYAARKKIENDRKRERYYDKKMGRA